MGRTSKLQKMPSANVCESKRRRSFHGDSNAFGTAAPPLSDRVHPDVAKQAPLYFKKVKGFAKDKNIGVDSVLNVIFYRQLMRLKMNGVSIMQKS